MKRLRQLRAERGWSLREFSRRSGVTKETISDAERGIRNPHPVTLAKMADALGVEASELLGEESAAAFPGEGFGRILAMPKEGFSQFAKVLTAGELVALIEPLGREQGRRQAALEQAKEGGDRAALMEAYGAMDHIAHLLMVATLQLHVTTKREAEAAREELAALAG